MKILAPLSSFFLAVGSLLVLLADAEAAGTSEVAFGAQCLKADPYCETLIKVLPQTIVTEYEDVMLDGNYVANPGLSVGAVYMSPELLNVRRKYRGLRMSSHALFKEGEEEDGGGERHLGQCCPGCCAGGTCFDCPCGGNYWCIHYCSNCRRRRLSPLDRELNAAALALVPTSTLPAQVKNATSETVVTQTRNKMKRFCGADSDCVSYLLNTTAFMIAFEIS